ncbi:hypothetical protein NQZ68_033823 [Dissostichus eleginoides]|nr:hypothetical protein NQZ68_033823 [Dissostichus eleginoides]
MATHVSKYCKWIILRIPASVAICCVNRYHTDRGSPWLRVGESVQYLCLAVNLACVADGLDCTGLNRADPKECLLICWMFKLNSQHKLTRESVLQMTL